MSNITLSEIDAFENSTVWQHMRAEAELEVRGIYNDILTMDNMVSVGRAQGQIKGMSGFLNLLILLKDDTIKRNTEDLLDDEER